jgi:hypothetical protein
MLKLSHANLTFLSGAIWMLIGIFLLQVGLKLLLVPTFGATPLLNLFSGLFNPHEAAIAIVAVSLFVGFLKGKHVLTKAAKRGIAHIQTLPNPAPIYLVYGKKYFLLIGSMIFLGLAIKYFGVPNDIRGAIDVAVGSALINGAIHYFRVGFQFSNSR